MKISQRGISLMLLMGGVFFLSSVEAATSYPIAVAGCGIQLTVSPTSTSVARGASVAFNISIKSSCGTDHIGWGPAVTSPTPTVKCDKKGVCTTDGPVLQQSTYHVIGSGGGSFTAAATNATLLTTWTITVTASDVTHCCTSRSENVLLTTDDFLLAASPKSVTVPAGQTAQSTITVSSVNGFTGTIYYTTNTPSAITTGISCNLQPDPVTLTATVTSISSTLSCSGTPGSYTVVTDASPYNGSPVRSASVSITIT